MFTRNIVFLGIAAIAGFMVWLWFQPVCRGGSVVPDEQACRSVAGFDRDFCRMAFSRTGDIARRSGPTYQTLHECALNWPRCIEQGPDGRAAPKPSHWCIVRAADRSLARLEPQYNDRRQ